jgi:hypothetical protein
MAAGDGSDTRTNLLDGVVSDLGGAGEVTGRREQILQAAQKLFAEQGFRETNLNDVATQLGLKSPAVTSASSVGESPRRWETSTEQDVGQNPRRRR